MVNIHQYPSGVQQWTGKISGRVPFNLWPLDPNNLLYGADYSILVTVDQHGVELAKEALDNVLQAGIGDLTPWAQHGSGPPSPLPKKKSEYDWAMPGGFPNLEAAFNK